jgi:hypothetical protein
MERLAVSRAQPPNLRALDREDVDQADIRILGKQPRAGGGQRGRDLPGQVRLTRGFVLEGIEDPERRVVDRKPYQTRVPGSCSTML